MLQIVIPDNKETIARQIKALKYAIEHDTNDKDKQIHSQFLNSLEEALKAL